MNLIWIAGLVLSLASQWCQARWISPAEADAQIEKRVIHMVVHADGSAVVETLTRVKILNETGRGQWGTLRFNYTPKNARLEVLQAQVENAGAVFSVGRHDIVDTQIFATENGFDESKQVVVPFPQVQVGSILTFALRQTLFRPYLEGQFFEHIWFGDSELLQDAEVSINSERQLFFQINDPTSHLQFTKNEQPKHYQYSIRLKAPLIQRISEEVRAILPDRKMTWVAMTSAASYTAMVEKLVPRFEEILKAPLPEKFRPVIDRARSETDPINKINVVLSSIADMIRYMGDWRSVDGAWVPRSLERIGETRFGDCKDFSTLTVKILRELGFKSYVAFVYRGVPAHDATDVAAPTFNHAIVWVELGSRQLWLDPTEFQSFASGVFEDIAGRRALVLEPGKIALHPIAFTPPADNLETVAIHTRLSPGKLRRDQLEMTLNGSIAASVTGEELRFSKDRIEEATVANAANMAEVVDYHFEPFELKSRIVTPIQLKLTIRRRFNPIYTSMGPALDFSPSDELKELLRIDRSKRESDIKLGIPSVVATTVLLENVHPKGHFLHDCTVRSPWIDYSFQLKAKMTQVVRRLEIKKYSISAEEVKSEAFAQLQDQLQSCGQPRYLVFESGDKR